MRSLQIELELLQSQLSLNWLNSNPIYNDSFSDSLFYNNVFDDIFSSDAFDDAFSSDVFDDAFNDEPNLSNNEDPFADSPKPELNLMPPSPKVFYNSKSELFNSI